MPLMSLSFTRSMALTLLLTLAWGCKTPADEAPAKASSVDAKKDEQVSPATPSKPVVKAEIPVVPSEASHDPELLKAVGTSCVVDLSCPKYLRCIDRACAIPQAMSGVSDATTPKVTFWSATGDKSLATFFVELATDDQERARGLMYRTSMKDDWGMIFIYPDDGHRSFWMKNTFIPLDMVFINSRGLVMGAVENATPQTLDPRNVDGLSRYVLELKPGWAKKYGITRGARMQIEHVKEEYRPTP